MDDIKIRIGLGATIALPGYNSVRVDYSEEAVVPWDGDLKEARAALYNRVDDFLTQKVNEIKADVDG